MFGFVQILKQQQKTFGVNDDDKLYLIRKTLSEKKLFSLASLEKYEY